MSFHFLFTKRHYCKNSSTSQNGKKRRTVLGLLNVYHVFKISRSLEKSLISISTFYIVLPYISSLRNDILKLCPDHWKRKAKTDKWERMTTYTGSCCAIELWKHQWSNQPFWVSLHCYHKIRLACWKDWRTVFSFLFKENSRLD